MKQIVILLMWCVGAMVGHAQTITTVVGTGVAGYSGDGGPAISAMLNRPLYGFTDSAGNYYFYDRMNKRLRKVDVYGDISTVAGDGTEVLGYPGDGHAATAISIGGYPYVSKDGVIYILGEHTGDHRVKRVDAAGNVQTIAGTGTAGYAGDGGPATAALVANRGEVATKDKYGHLYVSNSNPMVPSGSAIIRKIDTSGIISSIAGVGAAGHDGDGGPASAAGLSLSSMTVDQAGVFYVSDGSCIRKIDTTGIINLIAGEHAAITYYGDGVPASAARFYGITHLTVDDVGNLFVSDFSNSCIRRIDRYGIIRTVAGTPTEIGYSGDGGAATACRLAVPSSVALLPDGSYYVTDLGNHRVRKVSSGNQIPYFSGGELQRVVTCHDSTTDISAQLSVTDINVGQTLIWLVTKPPMHGSISMLDTGVTRGGVASHPTVVHYTPHPGYIGNDTLVVRVDDDISVGYTTIVIELEPHVADVFVWGKDTLCVGDTTTYKSNVTGGSWTASTGGITVGADGLVLGVSAGPGVVEYVVRNTCNEVRVSRTIVVLPVEECELGVAGHLGSGAGLMVRPNPTEGNVQVTLPEGAEGLLYLTDAMGRTVGSWAVPRAPMLELDVPAGMYVLTAKLRTGVVRTKVMVR